MRKMFILPAVPESSRRGHSGRDTDGSSHKTVAAGASGPQPSPEERQNMLRLQMCKY